jgi:hypothetical protein
MAFAQGRAKTGGRKKGARNHRTLAAEAKPDGLNHLIEVMTSTDPVITPDLKLRAAIALSQYQHPKPAPSKPVGTPIALEPPKTAQEAREAIARITSMIAKAEIDGEHGSRIIASLEAFLSARAAELEVEVEKHRAEEGLASGPNCASRLRQCSLPLDRMRLKA